MVLEPIMISPEFLLQSTVVNTLSELDKILWWKESMNEDFQLFFFFL